MNYPRQLLVIGSLLAGSACGTLGSKETETVMPQIDYTHLASTVCHQFISHLQDEGNFTEPSLGPKAEKVCTDRLAETADYQSSWPTDRALEFSTGIAGHLPVHADDADADFLAQLIRDADPHK